MANPVTITLVLNLKAEAVLPFCAALPEMLKDTKKRPGFRSIRVMRHKSDPNQMIFIEEWNSEDDYMQYIAWRTETGAMDSMASAITSPPKMEIWPTLVAS
ncbi:MAG TPA: antibiotic biosynthesis monooxygenase family protein [Steroidobacteraceae bacterium]|nr:antibiotic biosynthesis monooxygenase family protein [Steroidobacteraceae bacterium]